MITPLFLETLTSASAALTNLSGLNQCLGIVYQCQFRNCTYITIHWMIQCLLQHCMCQYESCQHKYYGTSECLPAIMTDISRGRGRGQGLWRASRPLRLIQTGWKTLSNSASLATNVITGDTEASSIFLLDGGAIFSNNVSMFTNAAWLSDYARPGWFEVTMATPEGWAAALPANDAKDVANL